jgi:serine/threonine protein phosphatase PrpC
MNHGWAGPAWGEPSRASESPVPLRTTASAGDACYRADGGWSPEFVVMAASVAGVAHRLAGRRGEDAYAWALAGPGRLAVAIADGVSTAGRGGEGADVAVRAACAYLLGGESDNWGGKECEAAVLAAGEEVARMGGPVAAELSTTLVVALLSAAAGSAEVSLARVGDSSAFLLGGTEWRELFPDPDDEDFRGLPVEVLPLREGAGPGVIEISSVAIGPGSALVLLTDGVGDPLREGPATVAPALAEVLQDGPTGDLSPLDLANAADFSRRGCLDDRTIVAAWPLGGTVPGRPR